MKLEFRSLLATLVRRRGSIELCVFIAMWLVNAMPTGKAAETSSAILTVPSVSALLSLDTSRITAGAIVVVSGYSKSGDGGGGTFLWMPAANDTPDNVVSIAPNHDQPGRWTRQWWQGTLSPEMAGALGDGVTNDETAFKRLIAASRIRGAFTIVLTPGRRYYIPSMLDMSAGAPGLTLTGPSSPRYDLPSGQLTAPVTRIELNATTGATIKVGTAQVLRDVMIWRHGLPDAPHTLAEVRSQVGTWFSEDGKDKPLSVGVLAPFDDAVIEGCRIVGFHTGIRATGGRFKLLRDQIDTAGYAVEVATSKATSLIEDIAAGALWSRPARGRDSYGDAGYRPGIGYYIHNGADGLQMNSVGAENYTTGIWIDGTGRYADWLVSVFQPDIETPPNDGKQTTGIKTTGQVRRLTILDPRIVIGNNGDGPGAALDFGHNVSDSALAENDNVTVIGGSLEVLSRQGVAVLMRKGATGALIGTTLNLANSENTGPVIRALNGVGTWSIEQPQVRGHRPSNWLEMPKVDANKIKISEPPGQLTKD